MIVRESQRRRGVLNCQVGPALNEETSAVLYFDRFHHFLQRQKGLLAVQLVVLHGSLVVSPCGVSWSRAVEVSKEVAFHVNRSVATQRRFPETKHLPTLEMASTAVTPHFYALNVTLLQKRPNYFNKSGSHKMKIVLGRLASPLRMSENAKVLVAPTSKSPIIDNHNEVLSLQRMGADVAEVANNDSVMEVDDVGHFSISGCNRRQLDDEQLVDAPRKSSQKEMEPVASSICSRSISFSSEKSQTSAIA